VAARGLRRLRAVRSEIDGGIGRDGEDRNRPGDKARCEKQQTAILNRKDLAAYWPVAGEPGGFF
jgi:hypothetical protein